MNCNFSHQHYRYILEKAIKSNFKITNFCCYKTYKNVDKIIILRHDVDYSPQRALALAKIENALKLKATYFVRVHGQHYHPFDKESWLIFKKILNLGHEIGLHTEARDLSRIFKINPFELFCREKEILEIVFKIKILSASEHGDFFRKSNYWQKTLLTQKHKSILKIRHIPEDLRDFYYLSDSCSQWKKGCLCENLEKFDKMQVLIHPDHWGRGAKEEIRKLIKAAYPNVYTQITRKWKI